MKYLYCFSTPKVLILFIFAIAAISQLEEPRNVDDINGTDDNDGADDNDDDIPTKRCRHRQQKSIILRAKLLKRSRLSAEKFATKILRAHLMGSNPSPRAGFNVNTCV